VANEGWVMAVPDRRRVRETVYAGMRSISHHVTRPVAADRPPIVLAGLVPASAPFLRLIESGTPLPGIKPGTTK
jgi:hypothetical protein